MNKIRSTESYISKKEIEDFVAVVKNNNWERIDAGMSQTICYDDRFCVLRRVRRLRDVLAEHKGDSSVKLSDFNKYQSLASLHKMTSESMCIAFDSEWYFPQNDGHREMLTWQFSLIYHDALIEFIFIKMDKYILNLEYAIGRILDSLPVEPIDIRKVRKYFSLGKCNPKTKKYVEIQYDNKKDAITHSEKEYDNGKKVQSKLIWKNTKHTSITLICHAGKADLSSLDQSGAYNKDILRHCSEVQGGLVSVRPVNIYPNSINPAYANNHYKYPVSLNISDTMCHAPSKKKSLKDLGAAIGWDKIQLDDGVIEHMDKLFITHPLLYVEYASNDAMVSLLYAASLYDINHTLPLTITSAAANVVKDMMEEYLGVSGDAAFERQYRGLSRQIKGKTKLPNRLGFVENSVLEPISNNAHLVQYFAQQGYHGGYNGCSAVGYFDYETYDYDLKNAYPTAMAVVPDIDWVNPIHKIITEREMTLNDFHDPDTDTINPLLPVFCYVRFEFPQTVQYPTIPVNVDGIPIYPRTSKGMDGVYACGPEIYLALKLGATIYCETGYVLNRLKRMDGTISYALQNAVKQLILDRLMAKAEYGKKSLMDLILKCMVNALYGKVAQNVIDKSKWNAYIDKMENMGCSAITNPVSASMITSIVRAELLAAQNQLYELGYFSCSATTDGFITNCPEDILKSLDLYGVRTCMEAARLFLTDYQDSEIWEIKHVQGAVLNFSTRGNVGINSKENPYIYHEKAYEAVCAHNGVRSGYPSDSDADRSWLMRCVLKRTGPVSFESAEWTTFKDLVKGKPFIKETVVKNVHMDFDFKRKPDRNSFENKQVIFDDCTYIIANFTTVPYKSIDEYREYRQKSKNFECLRTMDEWDRFWFETDSKATNVSVKVDIEWSILISCIMMHRAGICIIPKLNELKGNDRNEWINSHNTSKKKFKDSDYKNCGRVSRQANILPREMLKDKLEELMLDK